MNRFVYVGKRSRFVAGQAPYESTDRKRRGYICRRHREVGLANGVIEGRKNYLIVSKVQIRGNQEHADFIGSGIEPLGFMSIVESTTVIFQQQPGVTPIEDGQGAFVIGRSVCGQRPSYKSKNRFIEVRDRALVVTKPDLHGPSIAVAETKQYGLLAEGIDSQTERFVVSPYDPVEVGK